MSLSVADIVRPGPGEWDAVFGECAYATYFHSREWAEIWSDSTDGACRPDPRTIVFSDGRRALLPLSSRRVSRWGARRFFSSPAGTFGGWLSGGPLTADHAALLAEYLTEALGRIVWRLNPYDPLAAASGVAVSEEDETHALALAGGYDAVVKGWKAECRTAVHKALRAGVTVRVAETRDDWLSYYRIYEDSLRRWGDRASSRYGWGLFDGMVRRGSRSVKLWLAECEGETAAGALCFYAPRHAVYWHGAALERHFARRPVNLLMGEIIRDACAAGCAWFDFNPSGGHEGVKAFKRSFGAIPLRSPVVVREAEGRPDPLGGIGASLRRVFGG